MSHTNFNSTAQQTGISFQYIDIVSRSVCVCNSIHSSLPTGDQGCSGLRGTEGLYLADLGAREHGVVDRETGADLPLWKNRKPPWAQNRALVDKNKPLSFCGCGCVFIVV